MTADISRSRGFGLGPMPGTDPAAAAEIVLGETGDLPAFPELPARGVGSDPVGRTAALLAGLYVEPGPRAWRLCARPQLLTRRSRDLVEADLDTCGDVWGSGVSALKIQVTGPWTLAAAIELPDGHRAITDRGALRDLTGALIHGTLEHVADVHRRFGSAVVVQVDEPLLADVCRGTLRGTSDYDTIRAVPGPDAAERLRAFSGELRDAGVSEVLLNLTAAPPLWEVAGVSGADTVLLDPRHVKDATHLDGLGTAVSEGVRVGLGAIPVGLTGFPASGDLNGHSREVAVRIARLWDELGLHRNQLTSMVDVHPRAGLSAVPADVAVRALTASRTVAGMLTRDAGDL
ncbi:hypothetical protein JIM95_008975 [Corynebacterium sp. CCM 8835]|uniref:Methionine synthase n=1 Tax=Corynebacterium antarcticum TaxID=2800405 RepID=A0A9Q4CEV9_9CORY|nr:hypothetical protein [Corynebacterium antarcticum]MCK7643019.1 hypothetical protein [Corynebacterium antarcticum]MCL0246265.1 hypothetical protein [Corynebacterium antarcticum]MCX7492516.1 hypothetical protein [Corynebacterium antarcticum]MCX7538377.1 hypothetical protein [Corynebacterium antarcticum]MCX7540857.1 hypothetical protein [Corynebacterium antarcticum]